MKIEKRTFHKASCKYDYCACAWTLLTNDILAVSRKQETFLTHGVYLSLKDVDYIHNVFVTM